MTLAVEDAAMVKTLVVVVMGSGYDTAGDCLGLRPFLDELSKTRSFHTIYIHRITTKGNEIVRYARRYEHVLVIGHGEGADEAWTHHERIVRLTRLIMLDPVPKGLRWLNPLWKYPATPNTYGDAAMTFNFHGPTGRAIKNGPLSLDFPVLANHNGICIDEAVQEALRMQVNLFTESRDHAQSH